MQTGVLNWSRSAAGVALRNAVVGIQVFFSVGAIAMGNDGHAK